MSSLPTPYPSPAPIRSGLFKNPPESVPPTDELESLHAELKILKQKTLERAKKAGEDLRIIEESMRRIKEKEKGKARAVEKVKKERGYTPLPEPEAQSPFGPSPPAPHRQRFPSVSSTSSTPFLPSRPALDTSRSNEDSKKKKKKRKREADDSDGEPEPQRARKMSPPPPPTHPPPPAFPSKSIKSSISTPQPRIVTGPDWSLPAQSSLLHARPPIPLPPVPGPSKPTDVMEDFSKAKQPSQTQVTTFYTSLEPWLRPIKEEDVGFLEYAPADESDPYIVPRLGRHYAEVWAEEDTAMHGGPLPGTAAAAFASGFGGYRGRAASTSGAAPGSLPRWEPSTLADVDLLTEEKGHGPLTERLVSALLPTPDSTVWKGVKAAEEAMEGRPSGGAGAAAERDKMTVADLEDRIKDSMRFLGLLDDQTDLANTDPVDDPISTALRQAQRQLRTVVATNRSRRMRLAEIAKDRLGYQEYVELRESLDRNITATYTKLLRKDAPKASKKKKKPPPVVTDGLMNGAMHGDGTAHLPPCPAALGLVTTEEMQLGVPEQLRTFVRTRRQWVDEVGGVFEAKQAEEPGRIRGLPERSVFEGIEDGAVRESIGGGGGGGGGGGAGNGVNGVDGGSTPGGSSAGAGPSRWTTAGSSKSVMEHG